MNFGGSIILFLGLMNRIPPEILEAASLDGITPVKEFLYIILPLIFPTISIYIINLLAGFFAQQGSLYTFTGRMRGRNFTRSGTITTFRSSGKRASPSIPSPRLRAFCSRW